VKKITRQSPIQRDDDTDFEGGGWRSPPKTGYRRTGQTLSVPAKAIALAFDIFSRYAAARLEAGIFFYGDRVEDGNAIVKAVVVPEQTNRWGNYHVTGDAMAAVALATRSYHWLNLSQIHSHPGRDVEHSPYDDEQANSRHALSFVFPSYGGSPKSWPKDIGVHEWQGGYWHLLSEAHARVRVSPVNGDAILIDLRKS
jgi:hypothetical protein